MKLKFSLKNKEASFEADVEGLVEKNLEYKKNNPNRKTNYQIRQEEKRKNLEFKQKQKTKEIIFMIASMTALIIVILIICAVGSALGWE